MKLIFWIIIISFLICIGLVIPVVLYNTDISVHGTKEQPDVITGVFQAFYYDDGCGDEMYCYTDILVSGKWYSFGSPCEIVPHLILNETYSFYYDAFQNMDCSGERYWDVYICKIVSNGDVIWIGDEYID